MLNNQPAQWDQEVDFIAVGSGVGGLGAAIVVHELGGSAIVLERTDKLGGVSALSMGEVWVPGNRHAAAMGIEDSPESGFRYIKRLAMGHGTEAAILNLTVHAREALDWFTDRISLKMKVIRHCPDYWYGGIDDAMAEGRLLEVEPFPAAGLGEWQGKTRVSPQMPYGLTHDDMYDGGGTAGILTWDFAKMGERLERDERCLGPGFAATFVKGCADRGIPMWTGANVVGLYGDGTRVTGVRFEQDGRQKHIAARRGVLLAVSSYERREDYNRTLSQQVDAGSLVFSAIDGANFRLACPFNARIAKLPDISLLCLSIPNEEDEEGRPMYRSVMAAIGQPHVIVVNRKGERFADESFYRDYGQKLDLIDGHTQTFPNFPCWAVMDDRARQKYPFGGLMPGQPVPEGLGHSAASLEELARLCGIDPSGLTATVAEFNPAAERGEDPRFRRGTKPWGAWMTGDRFHEPNANLGSLTQAPFHAIELKRMATSAIPAAGLLCDHHGRVMAWDDQQIPGLYAAGNSMARMETGAMMQSGISNARGMAYGWLTAHHAMGRQSELLAEVAARINAGT